MPPLRVLGAMFDLYIYIYIDLGEALGVQIARRGLEHWRFDEVHGVVDSVAYW